MPQTTVPQGANVLIPTSTGGLAIVGDAGNSAVRVNVVAGAAGGSTAVTVTNTSFGVSGTVTVNGTVAVSNPATSTAFSIAGTPTVTVGNPTTAVTVSNPATSTAFSIAGTPAVTISGTPTVTVGNPVTSVSMSTGGAVVPVYITTAAVSKISTSPGTLWSIAAYTTSTGTLATSIPGIVRLHNTTTASVTGATPVLSFPCGIIATSTGGSLAGAQQGDHQTDFGPRGLAFSAACSVDVVTASTGTTALANAKITALYTP